MFYVTRHMTLGWNLTQDDVFVLRIRMNQSGYVKVALWKKFFTLIWDV